MLRTMTQLDDELKKEAMNNMRQAFHENIKKFGMEKLSFEAVERLIFENRNSTQQAIKAQQEKAMQEAERREEEVRRFKEDQKQIMIEKERQAREKREQEAAVNNKQDRPAVQAQGIDEKYHKKVERLHWRAGVARLVVSIQGDNQNRQRSSIPLDGNGRERGERN